MILVTDATGFIFNGEVTQPTKQLQPMTYRRLWTLMAYLSWKPGRGCETLKRTLVWKW